MFELNEFLSIQSNLLANVSYAPRRALFDKINWNSRLFGIVGARGAGKTTLLLQRIAQEDKKDRRCLYISADHIQAQARGLYEIAARFFVWPERL